MIEPLCWAEVSPTPPLNENDGKGDYHLWEVFCPMHGYIGQSGEWQQMWDLAQWHNHTQAIRPGDPE